MHKYIMNSQLAWRAIRQQKNLPANALQVTYFLVY